MTIEDDVRSKSDSEHYHFVVHESARQLTIVLTKHTLHTSHFCGGENEPRNAGHGNNTAVEKPPWPKAGSFFLLKGQKRRCELGS